MVDDCGGRAARAWIPLALWLWLAVVAAIAIYAQHPPAPVDAGAPATAFSAARARARLRELVQQAHPVGSADDARVRDALVAALTSLGAEVHVETGTGAF